jgi:predicted 3-demethylubiquinone-9 3-methyltransferase (glyoxalase superfamily)
MIRKITPFLWFDNQAIEAAKFYVSVFKNSMITDETLTDPKQEEVSGTVIDEPMSVSFELDGQAFIAFNGGPYFKFTPAVSFYVDCADQAEVDEVWEKLLEGGEASQCGWLTDRYGVSWQIVPRILPQLLNQPDSDKAQKVMNAMLTMIKLDVETLIKASQ